MSLLRAGLIADSLALAPHWIYDPAEIQTSFGRVHSLLQPKPGSYHENEPAGGQTHYGYQALVLARSASSPWDLEKFRQALQAYWSSSAAYRDHATKAFLSGEESASSELGGASRAVGCWDLEDEELAVRIAIEQTSLTHDAEVAQVAGDLTHLAFHLKQGESMSAALESQFGGSDQFQRAISAADLDPVTALGALGRDCSLKSALPSLFYLLGRGTDYRTALTDNVMAGGDSAARGLLLGALLVAEQGDEVVPDEWKKQLRASDSI